ncbi:actin binding protein [Talaromyces marneffei ATCC 18224]|uniref:Actin binding protein, putative n=1 Tax=Talaromyces marneffei (strain ATCC 18224 / CBS 334.59 / QM 7333) TaxID=441960 RepID=B6QMJ4_TALMQ|nr:uncharacterized protein EYB26_007632 [Talaromyces marneffei]EEA22282.1 actin binding protein, putative [Talaromyces marneffei ATCC 18224]KAE8550272.1 hypothetical protein EYB25_006494 [Talaromyces marneffei]QGA19936.1 hypothetical protein EYB26_007632 [Talaromyces marneffei]
MASLNLSTNGPSITKSYQAIVNAAPATTGAAASPTFAQWAVFGVTTPLVNAFQPDAGNKESVLKVQSSAEGELADLIEDFSEGKIQFAFVRVKDPNTGLPKNVLIAWCGEGVPERTKGYFNSHLAAVGRFLQGYHVQITARSDRDLTPEGILQKVSDASGAKYSATDAPAPREPVKPPVATKPVFTASRSGGVAPPPGARRLPAVSRAPVVVDDDDDGWGADAPPVTRTQLEKVPSAYKPTKVDINQLTSQKQPESQFRRAPVEERSDVVKGGYQPIGKVDIAAIRRQARESGQGGDERPEPVKGAYQPVGKVDISAIRAKAQPAQERAVPEPHPEETEQPKPLSERSAAFQQPSERLTSLPKPKVANRFGGSSNFTGTKAPLPTEFGVKPTTAPVTSTSRTFADEGGKTPAQLWAERKARERGSASAPSTQPSEPVNRQVSGDGRWKSSYTGKSWAPVQTTHTGHSASSATARYDGEGPSEPASRDIPLSEDVPPPPPLNNKPNAGQKIPLPGLPTAPVPTEEEYPEEEETKLDIPAPAPQPRSPTPPTPVDREPSPIQVAMPVSRTAPETLVQDAHEEIHSPPQALPIRSMEQVVPDETELEQEHGRAVAETSAHVAPSSQSIRAIVQYDYEKAEDNEIELKEGEYVTDIEMVDEDWWLGVNVHGDRGLFPSNYVEIIEQASDVAQQEEDVPHEDHHAQEPEPEPEVNHHAEAGHTGHTATALYDYEAAEDNELSFPDGAKIVNIEFPDDDWWSGEYDGNVGLFPANYVELDQ